jgi:quinol monooxygenase YgiN
MIKVVAKFTIKFENVEEFKKLCVELIDQTKKETGCITYELFQDCTDSNILAFIEEWDNAEALTKHTKTEHFIRIVPQLELLKDKATEMNIYNQIS